MVITRAAADFELVDRCGCILTYAGRSTVTDGTNPQTVGPLREGLASLGITPAAFGAITDTDLAGVTTTAQAQQLLDIAELRLLRSALGWMTKVDQKISLGEQKLGQMRTDLITTIKDLETRCRQLYGYGLGSVSAGAIDLNFATVDPCWNDELTFWEQ